MAAVAKLVGEFQYPAGTIRSESARFEVDIEAFDRPAADPEARRSSLRRSRFESQNTRRLWSACGDVEDVVT